MKKAKKPTESSKYFEMRIYLPKMLGKKFEREAEEEHRTLAQQLTVILEDRYQPQPGEQ